MKRLLGLLLVMGMVGCGGGDPDVAALKTLGVDIKRNKQDVVVGIDFRSSIGTSTMPMLFSIGSPTAS